MSTSLDKLTKDLRAYATELFGDGNGDRAELVEEAVRQLEDLSDEVDSLEGEVAELNKTVDQNEGDARGEYLELSDAVLDALDAWGPRATLFKDARLKRMYDLSEGK